jgi:heme/copper-type cytochrome/quinol oxidase subunit 2
MSALDNSALRLCAIVLAIVAIVPAAWLSLRHMLELRDPEAPPRARALEAVWSIAPLIGLIALLVLAGLQ